MLEAKQSFGLMLIIVLVLLFIFYGGISQAATANHSNSASAKPAYGENHTSDSANHSFLLRL